MLLNNIPLAKTAAALQNGELDLIDHVQEILTRLEEVEPQVQALIPEDNRAERLLAEAKALQTQYPDPSKRPPLYGVVVGVKDIFHVQGTPTQAGSKLPATALTGPEAICVTQLKEAGALILGKTVTTEFAYFAPGPTRNPHNLEHTPGGSSSGSAAAVAAGLCSLSLGTQTIGSVIRPAAYCGIVGFKPSYNRINPTGLIFVSKSLDHVGFFSQDVVGINVVAPILCQDWQADIANATPQSLPVLGVPDGPYLQQATAEGLSAFENHLLQLETVGYIIKRVPMLEDIETITHHHVQLMAAELAEGHAEWFKQYQSLYRNRTADLIKQGQAVTQQEIKLAKNKQMALREKLSLLMTETGVDLWVAPAAPGPAPAGINATGNPAMNLPWTNAGMPAITVPASKIDNKLPLGLQLVGAFMGDEQLVAWTRAIEAVFR